jgi:hypothetical protein
MHPQHHSTETTAMSSPCRAKKRIHPVEPCQSLATTGQPCLAALARTPDGCLLRCLVITMRLGLHCHQSAPLKPHKAPGILHFEPLLTPPLLLLPRFACVLALLSEGPRATPQQLADFPYFICSLFCAGCTVSNTVHSTIVMIIRDADTAVCLTHSPVLETA